MVLVLKKLIILLFQAVEGVCFLFSIWPNLSTSKIVGVYLVFVAVFLPISILVFVYGRIAWVLSRKVTNDALADKMNKGASNDQVVSSCADLRMKKYLLAKRNTIKTLFLVAVCFVICWTGNQVLVFLYNIGYKIEFDSEAYQFFVFMVCVNCTINPFIYLVQYREDQTALKALICKNRKGKSPEESISFSSVTTTTASKNVIDFNVNS